MSTTTDTTPTDTTQALPATIELSTETLVDVVAHLYALENVLGYLNAGQDTPTSRAQGRLADRLLLEPCGGDDETGSPEYRHPIAVEACARSEEVLAEWIESLHAGGHRANAALIRAKCNGLAIYDEREEDHGAAAGEKASDAS